LIVLNLKIVSYAEVDLENHSELKAAYLALYDEYVLLGGQYKDLLGRYNTLLLDHQTAVDKNAEYLTRLNQMATLSEGQINTIDSLHREIDTLMILIADLRKKKNPLLNFDLNGNIGYNSLFYFTGGVDWLPLKFGWFKAGVYGDLGYTIGYGFTYQCGLKMVVSLFDY